MYMLIQANLYLHTWECECLWLNRIFVCNLSSIQIKSISLYQWQTNRWICSIATVLECTHTQTTYEIDLFIEQFCIFDSLPMSHSTIRRTFSTSFAWMFSIPLDWIFYTHWAFYIELEHINCPNNKKSYCYCVEWWINEIGSKVCASTQSEMISIVSLLKKKSLN